ncbi:class I SAM-dependent methyltransferase [Arthrobacter mobilis]|uniref:Methyltransferase n=1 Tax=Arthrobacter mobilis TaxID=2724944 RepID=A0A7X6HGP5_9MICC|nr:methyltransferase [Arthrobacter mobilis]NKX55833.1 methyltransferase [Arthrobacter mobilis]
MPELDFAALRRYPDIEAENLYAYDAADRLLLDTAADALAGCAPGQLAVIGDQYGALTLGAAAGHGLAGIRVHQDPLSGEQALANNARGAGLAGVYTNHPLGPELLTGATVVLLRLPRSLEALEETASLVAAHADPAVQVFAGGMVKHMALAMNQVLGRYFSSVAAGLARQKARVLTAAGLKPAGTGTRFPLEAGYDVGLTRPLQLRAYGATFGGAKLDPGTRFLLPQLAQARPARTAIDLGCGNGSIAAYLALSRPQLHVLACDQSASAVASTAATAAANGVAGRVEVLRDDALSAQPDASAELIVLNPPFHVGSTVHAGIALKLFADAGRVLAPGGELWTVWNSHLRYRPHLERLVGPTRQMARNPKFTVTVSTPFPETVH